MIKVTHIITGLNVGGAETMLYKLLSHTDRTAFQTEVISLTNIGSMGEKIRALGISVKAAGLPSPVGFLRLISFLQRQKPDIVQTWMHHADVIGGIATKIAYPQAPVIWNVRYGKVAFFQNKPTRTLVIRLGSILSHWLPKKIIYCAHTVQSAHEQIGYAKKKGVYIPNGFDLGEFHPDPEARASARRELGVGEGVLLIGMVARFDPLKNHRGFCAAAKMIAVKHPEAHFVLCGKGIDRSNKELMGWVKDSGVADRFHLLGRREDIPRITAALDIATLVSFSEGFPNVVGEAMACGVPCVATNAGDAAEIIGDAGITAKSPKVADIAAGWLQMLEMPKRERIVLGQRARERIISQFALDDIIKRYGSLYQQTCLVG